MILSIFGAFFSSLFIALFSIPSVIKVAEFKNLFDSPDERKVHKSSIPTLGGIAIFASLLISSTLWLKPNSLIQLQYITCSLMVLFFVGIKDDIFTIVAYKKLLMQIFAAFILVHFAEIRLTSMYGLFGIHQISIVPSYLLSLISIVGITNSINFIDGVDSLAGTIGAFCSLMFGIAFYLIGSYSWSLLCFALLGGLLGFLYYNKSPARIFMGDTGALVLGMMCAIFAIVFIESNLKALRLHSGPVIAFSILIIPVFDTIRVATRRVLRGRSPFHPDKTHIHHVLLRRGFSHSAISKILIVVNLLIVVFAYYSYSIFSWIGVQELQSECGLIAISLFLFGFIYVLEAKKGAITKKLMTLAQN